MYYREEIINGVLCCKYTPNDEWKPLGSKQLNHKIIMLERELANCKKTIEQITKMKLA